MDYSIFLLIEKANKNTEPMTSRHIFREDIDNKGKEFNLENLLEE